MSDQNTRPVIVGVGAVTDKIKGIGKEPLELMAVAIERACQDTGSDNSDAVLRSIDSIDILNEYSWPYESVESLLADRLAHTPERVEYSKVGGEQPIKLIYEAALRIQSGSSQCAVIVGGEAAYSAAAAAKTQQSPDWHPRHPNPPLEFGRDMCRSEAITYGATEPVHVYPFYENATQKTWGQTQGEALAETGKLLENFSQVASENPDTWLNKASTAADIITPTPNNRPIAWPYTKCMVANMFVNQGAAVMVMSEAKARELGIPSSKWVYIRDGVFAREPRDYLARDGYDHSKAQNVVLDEMIKSMPSGVGSLDFLELYSCFPVVPKMARRQLGLPEHVTLTSTGGMSFFGAPLNNYMTHAVVSMVRQMRESLNTEGYGLLYGQGEFVTKHFGLLIAPTPSDSPLREDIDLTATVETSYGEVPEFVHPYSGAAKVETFTLMFNHQGEVKRGSVIARTSDNKRTMAAVDVTDQTELAVFMDYKSSPIGREGLITTRDDGTAVWHFSGKTVH